MEWAAKHKPSSDEMALFVRLGLLLQRQHWPCWAMQLKQPHILRSSLFPSPHKHQNWIVISLTHTHTHTNGKTLLCMDSIPADSTQVWHGLVWSKSSLLTEAHPPWHRGHFPSHQPAPTPQIPHAMRITKVPDLSHTSFYTVTLLTSSAGCNPDLNPLHVTKCCSNWSFCWRIVLQRETDVGGMCQSAQCQCTSIFQISPLFFHHWGSTWGKTGRY